MDTAPAIADVGLGLIRPDRGTDRRAQELPEAEPEFCAACAAASCRMCAIVVPSTSYVTISDDTGTPRK